jgi:hypothetical protein
MVGDLVEFSKFGFCRLDLLSTEDLANQARMTDPRLILGPMW